MRCANSRQLGEIHWTGSRRRERSAKMLTNLALGRGRDAMLGGSWHRKNHKRNRTRPSGTMVIRSFCRQLDRNTDLREGTMNRTFYKVTRRLAPALTVVYRAIQIVRLLISW
jgi:hypothetical protein